MNAPFGVAMYPGTRPLKLDLLPPTMLTLTYNESMAALVEDDDRRLITTHCRGAGDRFGDTTERVRTARGRPGRETASVRRRPTTVPRGLADLVMLAIIERRQHAPRSWLASLIGITQRQLHLAELGCVQPEALHPIIDYLGISVD